jgi:outer membrane protein TolC
MKTNYYKKPVWLLLLWCLAVLAPKAFSQQSFSLSEAIDYGIKNHANVKNAQIDVANAQAKVQEIKAIGLPQINGQFVFIDNLVVPRMLVPAKTFNPNAADGEVSALKFGTSYSTQGTGVTLNQLLFDGSYLLGLKASQVYIDLAQKNVKASKITIAENVAKAYYGVLVNEERIKLLTVNIARLDSILRDTRELNKQGFVEKLDVQRLEVQVNNLKTERQNIDRYQEIAIYLLKFQMGYPLNESLTLSDKLANVALAEITPADAEESFKYNKRIEFSILETQERLAQLDLKNNKVGYLPRVLLSLSSGYSTGTESLGNFFTQQWFNATALNFVVQIPIFDGFSKKYKIVQAENRLTQIKNGMSSLKDAIDFQQKTAQISLKNNWATLQEHKANMELAQEVVRVTRLKYKAGVGSNLEIVNAEAALKEAQTNYFTTLYNALIAKVDLDKARGTLSE